MNIGRLIAESIVDDQQSMSPSGAPLKTSLWYRGGFSCDPEMHAHIWFHGVRTAETQAYFETQDQTMTRVRSCDPQ